MGSDSPRVETRRGTKSVFLGLPAERVFERRTALRGKKRIARKCSHIILRQKAILRFALRFQNAPAADVNRRHPAFEQLRTDHQKAVTMQGIFLGAHQSDFLPPRKLHNAIHFGHEIARLSA